MVVDKPDGLLSVAGKGPTGAHNVEAFLARDRPFVRMAHRLDQATSGLLVAAKDLDAYRFLQRAFQEREVKKGYLGVLSRSWSGPSSGRIELRTRLDPEDRPRQVVDPVLGKLGVTEWRYEGEGPLGPSFRFEALTGRTHQIRLHAAAPEGLGVALRGDRLYGEGGERLLLHASRLRFPHPDGGHLGLSSDPPFSNLIVPPA
ncbi:MAG: pseudouridine synthase [Myxococcota bacterium]